MLLRLMALVTALVHMVSSQERGGASVLKQGDVYDSQSVIVTPRTTAWLSCESGDMVVRVNFSQPFRGLMYAFRSRRTPCSVRGQGALHYDLRIPLKGCGTWQESPRVFVNNVTVRFHAALELEEDETKTVVCRYPPPLTHTPGSVSIIDLPTRLPPTPPSRVSGARLSEVEILILICLLLFLSLLTLGIGIAYFCLKRRNIRIVRKPPPSAPHSQITRLSSSNLHVPSSLLSSVLGHTVRIPRAVPYSAPSGRLSASPPLDGSAPADSAPADSTSSESTNSSDSLDQDDPHYSSRQGLFARSFPKSILSIPKAILRNSYRQKRWQAQPKVHQYIPNPGTVPVRIPPAERRETEDQTVTTVLEPELHIDESYFEPRRTAAKEQLQTKAVASQKPLMPVYAQVDKNKKTSALRQPPKVAHVPKIQPPPGTSVPGAARRQRHVVETIPEENQTVEDVTKDTMVTTSVRREIKETRILSPTFDAYRRDLTRNGKLTPVSEAVDVPDSSTGAGKPLTAKPPKTILIRDVADIYLTTTVETETREVNTRMLKDTLVKKDETQAPVHPKSPVAMDSSPPKDLPKGPKDFSVIIRQRPQVQSKEVEDGSSTEMEPPPRPKFDVKIRTIPPESLQPKKRDSMVEIPPLEMPSTVDKLREALMPKTGEASEPRKPYRSMDSKKPSIPEEESTVSSDSYRSAASLRERSSSEVLEVAPTLPSHQGVSKERTLERSTSEISPGDHVRWIGAVPPVLENMPIEFLSNIPVVAQGGFFNRQLPKNDADRHGV